MVQLLITVESSDILKIITVENLDILKLISPSVVILTRRKVCVEPINRYISVKLHLKIGKICNNMRKTTNYAEICDK